MPVLPSGWFVVTPALGLIERKSFCEFRIQQCICKILVFDFLAITSGQMLQNLVAVGRVTCKDGCPNHRTPNAFNNLRIFLDVVAHHGVTVTKQNLEFVWCYVTNFHASAVQNRCISNTAHIGFDISPKEASRCRTTVADCDEFIVLWLLHVVGPENRTGKTHFSAIGCSNANRFAFEI